VAPAAGAAAGPVGAGGHYGGGGALGYSGGSGSGFGQLGPQFPALRVLQLRRVTSGSPHLWQLAPRLTSLVVWGEASNTGLIRWAVGCSMKEHDFICLQPSRFRQSGTLTVTSKPQSCNRGIPYG
jgi:hypothetical protein